MTNTKFTLGGFEVEEPMDGELWIVEAGRPSWRLVASLPFPSEPGDIPASQVKANAALFAAAPDLYKALEGMLLAYGTELRTCPDSRRARAALAKARGEKPA